MKQEPDELIKVYLSRLKATASLSNLSKVCSQCENVVTYKKETVYHVAIAGIRETNLKEK